MSQPIVLVIFYSRCGSTEKLALAAAVGAVQSRAAIRLRRVADKLRPRIARKRWSDCARSTSRPEKSTFSLPMASFRNARRP